MSGRGKRSSSRRKYEMLGVVRRKCANALKNAKNSYSTCFRDGKYYMKYPVWRRKLYELCVHKSFEIGISSVIGLNILTMAAEHYQQPEELDQILRWANFVFTFVFVIEALLKLLSFGLLRYFREKWNILDILIVISSVVGIVIEEYTGDAFEIQPSIIRVMRVLRVARVLKLMKISNGIRSLLETVAKAIPQVGNLGMLFLLLFFIFAALGVELFGDITCDENFPCDALGRHASFANFGIALLTLFRISTGDNWNGILKDTLRCPEGGDCWMVQVLSPLYFVVFVMMAQFVMVNVVVAVLMKQLEDSRQDENDEGYEEDHEDDDVKCDVTSDQLLENESTFSLEENKKLKDASFTFSESLSPKHKHFTSCNLESEQNFQNDQFSDHQFYSMPSLNVDKTLKKDTCFSQIEETKKTKEVEEKKESSETSRKFSTFNKTKCQRSSSVPYIKMQLITKKNEIQSNISSHYSYASLPNG